MWKEWIRVRNLTGQAKRIAQMVWGFLKRVSRYTLGMWELKSVVVLSNAQPFTRGLSIYNRVREVPFYIPQGYMKGRSIYWWYVEEPHESQVAMQVGNDRSYVLRCLNTSLTYHSNFYSILDLKLLLILSRQLGECLWGVVSNNANSSKCKCTFSTSMRTN